MVGSDSGPSVGAGLDPFTGAGAYRTTSPKVAAPSSSNSDLNNSSSGPCFPVKEFIRFAAAPNYEALRKKLSEFIGSLDSATGLGEDSITTLLEIGTHPTWTESVDSLVKSCLSNWPAGELHFVVSIIHYIS